MKAVIGSGSFEFYMIPEINALIEQTVGCNLVSGLINYLFKSFPLIPVL
jgi:hypothetical protein